VTYSLWRLGILAATVGLLWLVGVRHWLPLMGFGVLIAAALSYLLLAKQRDATTEYLAARSDARARAGLDEEVEDEAVASLTEDAARASDPDGEAAGPELDPGAESR